MIDQHANAFLLRTRPFARTNVDVFEGPAWSLVDLADADGDGQIDIILEGDAYEDHWLEVASMRNGAPETIFSGLGYYL